MLPELHMALQARAVGSARPPELDITFARFFACELRQCTRQEHTKSTHSRLVACHRNLLHSDAFLICCQSMSLRLGQICCQIHRPPSSCAVRALILKKGAKNAVPCRFSRRCPEQQYTFAGICTHTTIALCSKHSRIPSILDVESEKRLSLNLLL